jgi:hypothetical protein
MMRFIINAKRKWLRPLFEMMQIASLKSAAREQNLNNISVLLKKAVPDLTNQFTTFKIDSEYLRIKARSQHAFQMKLTLKALSLLKDNSACLGREVSIIDIGVSSGTHTIYLRHLIQNDVIYNPFRFKFLSVNLDPIAVTKIRSKGLEAILCKAEVLFDEYNIKADLFLSYEMLEHLYDPIKFLEGMSKSAQQSYFVLTVPYMTQSRVGLYHIRHKQCREVYPENTHIFELSPMDWKLIFNHAGWEIVEELIYRQYPLRSWLRLMKPIWKKYDFEGFYGVILKKDRKWAGYYKSNS